MIRKALLPLLLAFSLVIAGCDGGVDSDLKAKPEEVRKRAEGLSADELQKRFDEVEKRANSLKGEVGTKEPSDAQMQQLGTYLEVGSIYATEMAKRKLK